MKKKMPMKKLAKWIALILFSPCLVGIFYWAFMDFVLYTAVSLDFDEMHQPGVRFLMKHGDKYAAYPLLDFFRNKPEFVYIEDHDKAIIELAKRFPEEEDIYLAYTVSSILDENTTTGGRLLLIYMLETWTGERFGFYTYKGKFLETPPDEERTARMKEAMINILNWWQKRQRDRLAEYIPDAAETK